ncbi:conserved hypothetical protein [delta proteobacterium NaphS2]|nr:conserved hypothetical protein [delta proteobacterium NaphS2]
MAICIFKWTESHLINTKSEEIPSENDFGSYDVSACSCVGCKKDIDQ